MLVALLGLMAWAIDPPPPPHTEPVDATAAGVLMQAVVTIDAEPSGKRFQGVWLTQDDGTKWLVAYRPDPLWRVYEGHPVQVTGQPYTPEGQAISASHLRVETLVVVGEQAVVDPRGFGPEQTLQGRFERRSGEPGSRSEGATWSVFVVEAGLTYSILNPSAVRDDATSVRARVVERSPFVAHRGSLTLWLVAD